jgi:crotonobetaine/carnitine-CoA ligase
MRTIGQILADKAVRNGSKTWLLWQNKKWSFEDLHQLTNRYANGFARLGIRKGTHVAVMLPNCVEYFGVVWGLGKIGAVAVPLNTAARGDLLEYFVAQSDSEWIVVAKEWEDRVAEIAPRLKALRGCLRLGDASLSASSLGTAGFDILDLKSLEGESDDEPPQDAVSYRDPHLILYTSGTTGPSKGVYLPHSQGHCVGRLLTKTYGYRSDDVIYTCLPIFHGNAFNYSCYPALWADATLALLERFSVNQFWKEIRQTGATQFNALGVMISMLLKQPPSTDDTAHSVRQCMALPLTRESYKDFGSRFGFKITSLYAMTETFPVTMFGPGDPDSKGSSAGKASEYAEMQILDEEDRPVPPGVTGEICVRPREPWIMMLGYYKMPEATANTMRNMWVHSGDRGYVDDDGYLFFVDRTKETIRRRGENISAYEVEMLVAKHPDVLEVAAIPVNSELSEDDVMIFVVRAQGSTLTCADLVRFCGTNMAYFMVPRFVHFVDAIPKTPSEKMEKYKLKSWAEQNRSQLWDREREGIIVAR